MRIENVPKNLFLTICLILLGFVIPSAAQENETIISRSSDGAFCELNKVYLEKLFLQQKETNEKLFVISAISKKEKQTLRSSRIYNANIFLTQIMKFDKNNVLFAENISNQEMGILEFYLGSKLFLVIEQPFNKIGCFTCCEEYTPKKARKRKKVIIKRKR